MPPATYTFLCLLSLHNPLRPETPAVLKALSALGVRPVMLTGDRAETAMTVGRDAGIGSAYCLSGRDIARMPLQEVARQAEHVSIFARLMPSQKGVLIRLLQQRGHSVAMVGDGPNDTVALRVADLGLSFVEISAPIARRVARILLPRLADIPALVGRARWVEHRLAALRLVRVIGLATVLCGLYVSWLC